MEIKKYFTKYIISAFIFVIIFPFLLNIIGKGLRSCHAFFISNSSGWLGFFGGYIGGIFTLSGVLLTIYYNRKQLQEDKRISMIPYLDFSIKGIDIEDARNYLVDSNMILFNYLGIPDIKYRIRFFLEIENLGLGNAIDIAIPQIWAYNNASDKKFNISINNKKSYYIEIRDNFLSGHKEINFDIFYKDLLGNNYKQKITLRNLEIEYNGEPEYLISITDFSSPNFIAEVKHI